MNLGLRHGARPTSGQLAPAGILNSLVPFGEIQVPPGAPVYAFTGQQTGILNCCRLDAHVARLPAPATRTAQSVDAVSPADYHRVLAVPWPAKSSSSATLWCSGLGTGGNYHAGFQ